MGVWSPAFQHQFLDGNLMNYSAAPGSEPFVSFEAPVRAADSAGRTARAFPSAAEAVSTISSSLACSVASSAPTSSSTSPVRRVCHVER